MNQANQLANSIWKCEAIKKICGEYGIDIDIEHRPFRFKVQDETFVFHIYYLHTTYVDHIEMPVSTFEYYSGSELRLAGINSLLGCIELSWKKYLEVPAADLQKPQPQYEAPGRVTDNNYQYGKTK